MSIDLGRKKQTCGQVEILEWTLRMKVKTSDSSMWADKETNMSTGRKLGMDTEDEGEDI